MSFLAADEPFANQIAARLGPALRTFIYSKRQEQLAGRNGVEEFREVFRRNSHLTVILHREGWGDTPWTRVEEDAIRDRAFAEGWRHLLVVRMDQAVLRPWIPDTRLYFDPTAFPIEDLVAAIKARCAELGINIRPPSIAEMARAQH
jgi:hypothetical protein